MDRRLEKLVNLFLMAMAVFFAPIWIPVVLVFVVPTMIVISTILTTIVLTCLPFVTVLFGMIGIPLLVGTAVMALFCILSKTYKKISRKMQQKWKGFILKWQKWARKRLSRLPFIKEFVNRGSNEGNEKSSFSDSEKPLYEDESDVETVVVHSEPAKMHFPSPKPSFPLLDMTESRKDMEIFFDHVEELYTVIRSLRKMARDRAHRRIVSKRRNTLA